MMMMMMMMIMMMMMARAGIMSSLAGIRCLAAVAGMH